MLRNDLAKVGVVHVLGEDLLILVHAVDEQPFEGLDEMLIGYIRDDMGMGLEDDLTPAPSGWRRLGVIIGMREVED